MLHKPVVARGRRWYGLGHNTCYKTAGDTLTHCVDKSVPSNNNPKGCADYNTKSPTKPSCCVGTLLSYNSRGT